ncbi:MAG TPA: N-acetylmannosamine-6-phosphate 2-epimerase [Mycobacteriales bacterium]|nr:N-acetylmannosamine-6-phosphate 2-epimerase [Mycobacteriales bacterium]
MGDVLFPAGSLIVSCQASTENPLHGPTPMALMARAAESGGAAGIRANGPADVAAIRSAVALPIIGIYKLGDPQTVFITPTLAAAAEVVRAGADLVAVDATLRERPDGNSIERLIRAVHDELGVPVMADVDTLEAGVQARAAGADLVATTLSGYTNGSPPPDDPDVDLVRDLAARVDCPIVAEGRYRTPAEVRSAFAAGAHAVVVGTAITNPAEITARLVRELR